MTWLTPLAWIGLISLLVPLLIHLLSRQSARVQPFPTLRFLDVSRLQPVRRTRIRDPLLLLVRMGILAMAVAALAGPLFRTEARTRNAGSALARAIVIDTSASMARSTVSGEPALSAARGIATELAGEASTAVLLETRDPVAALPGAVSWLSGQPGAREIVIVSDFQLGVMREADLARVPAEVGLRFRQLEIPDVSSVELALPGGRSIVRAGVVTEGSRTRIAWRETGSRDASTYTLEQLASPSQEVLARAMLEAAVATGAPTEARAMSIVHRGFADREEIRRETAAVTDPDAAALLLRVARDPILSSRTTRAAIGDDTDGDRGLTAVGTSIAPAALAGLRAGDASNLLLFPTEEAGAFSTAALVRAALRAENPPADVMEHETRSLASENLRGMERPPARAIPSDEATQATDARWFWGVVLLLLLLEAVVRRRARAGLEGRDG